MRWLAILCLALFAIPAHAQLAPRSPAGLPPTELAQTWLQQDPGVQEAAAGLEAAARTAGMLRVSPNEWSVRIGSQRRKIRTPGAGFVRVDTVELVVPRSIPRAVTSPKALYTVCCEPTASVTSMTWPSAS